MRKYMLGLLALWLALLPVASVAQEAVPNPGSFFPQPGNRKLDADVWVTGKLYRGTAQTDWVQWFPAVQYCRSDVPSSQLVPTRIAAFDWALARVATGAETYNVVCTLNLPTRTTASAGWKLTGFDLVYQLATAIPVNMTWQGLRIVTYANNGATTATNNAAVWLSATPTLTNATQTNPYLTTGTLATPTFLNQADQAVVVEFQAVLQNTSDFRVIGVAAKYSRAD